MPSLVTIRIERGRDLPAMDRNTSTDASTDAYVEVRLESQSQRTSTCRRKLNPEWNEEFKFEFLDDSVLQDEPVELRCMDQDLYSSEVIGVVYIDLSPLIMRTTFEAVKDLVISGWFPIYDTARGVRGALSATVKLQFIGNENPFLDSSAGIQFFTCSTVSPRCFFVQDIIGFVEELVSEDDPDNNWQDFFLKGNKTSNDNRMKVLYNMSAEVRRKLGKKVFECGGNAVLGYSFHFDTEGSGGIVARAYGTACKLLRVEEATKMSVIPRSRFDLHVKLIPEWRRLLRTERSVALVTKDVADVLGVKSWRTGGTSKNASSSDMCYLLQAHPGNVLTATCVLPFAFSRDGTTARESMARHIKTDFHQVDAWTLGGITAEASLVFQTEVQLITLWSFPAHVQVKLGGLVLARSVKLLSKAEAPQGDEEAIEGWWQELREEIKSHAKTLCCRYVVGYTETCDMHGDVCILSAMGTAAQLKGTHCQPISLPAGFDATLPIAPRSPPRRSSVVKDGTDSHPLMQDTLEDTSEDLTPLKSPAPTDVSLVRQRSFHGADRADGASKTISEVRSKSFDSDEDPSELVGQQLAGLSDPDCTTKKRRIVRPCAPTHVPYNHNTAPFAFMRLVPCLCCKRKWVPETILSTTDMPMGLPVTGKGRLLEARVCRIRKGASGEVDAVKVSEMLPFIEYDLQRQITLKMKVMNMNAAFNYSCKINVSNDVIVSIATCTAVHVISLPPPSTLHIVRNKDVRAEHDARLEALIKQVDAFAAVNREISFNNSSQEVKDSRRPRDRTSTNNKNQLRVNFDGESTIQEKVDLDEEGSIRASSSSSSSRSSSSFEDSHDDNDEASLASPSSSSGSSDQAEDDDASVTQVQDLTAVVAGEDEQLPPQSVTTRGRRTLSFASSARSDRDDNKTTHRNSNAKIKSSKEERLTTTGVGETPKRSRKMVYQDDRAPFVLEVDEETDADIVAALSDWIPPLGFAIVTSSGVPGSKDMLRGFGRFVTVLRRSQLLPQKGTPPYLSNAAGAHNSQRITAPSKLFNLLVQQAYTKLCFTVRQMVPCAIMDLSHFVNVLDDGHIEVLLTAMVHRTTPQDAVRLHSHRNSLSQASDNSDMAEISANTRLWIAPKVDHNRNTAASPSAIVAMESAMGERFLLNTRSQSFDQSGAGLEKPSRFRAVSNGSNDSAYNQSNPMFSEAAVTNELLLSDSGVGFPDEEYHYGGKVSASKSVAADDSNHNQDSSTRSTGQNTRGLSSADITMPNVPRPATSLLQPGHRRSSTAQTQLGLAQVLLTSLPDVPGSRIKRYLGPVHLHFIKDSWSVRGEGSMASFSFVLLSEVHALARSHVAALGGNALLSYKLVPQEAGGRVSRKQGYSLFSVLGDAVLLEFLVESSEANGQQAGFLDVAEAAISVPAIKI